MTQIVLEFVAIDAVVDQVIVAIDEITAPHQIPHLFVESGVRPGRPDAVAYRQSFADSGDALREELHIGDALHTVLHEIGRAAVLAVSVLPVKFVPVDLGVADIVRPPDIFHFEPGYGVRLVAGHPAVVVRHRARSVVPCQRTVTPDARFRREGRCERSRIRQADPVCGCGQRNRFASDAPAAHFSVLIAPRRVVEGISRQVEGFPGR